MNEDYRLPTAELVEDRIKPLVAKVYAVEVGQHDHTVQLESVQGVGDLLHRTVNVRKLAGWRSRQSDRDDRPSCVRQTIDVCGSDSQYIYWHAAPTTVSGKREETQAPTVSIVVPAYNAEANDR